MIDELDRQIKGWMDNVLGGNLSSLGPPRDEKTNVSIFLLDLLPSPPPRTGRLAPHQFILRYLISTWDEEPEIAHKRLGDMAFAALEQTVTEVKEMEQGVSVQNSLALVGLEVEFQPVPAEMWETFGVLPRPSFFLRVLIRRDRAEAPVPHVKQPLVITTTVAHGFG